MYHKPTKPSVEELDYIDEWLHYEHDTGILYRFLKKKQVYRQVGAKNNNYLVTRVLRREVYNHHIAWYIFYGAWPEYQIDHKDLNRSNNKIDNLREVTNREQSLNTIRSITRELPENIYLNSRKNRYIVTIYGRYIGTFTSIEEAIEYRDRALEV